MNNTKKLSIRTPDGKNTSISVNKNIIALYIVIHDSTIEDFLDFLFDTLDAYLLKTGKIKGFSQYLTLIIYKSILEEDDYQKYLKILDSI